MSKTPECGLPETSAETERAVVVPTVNFSVSFNLI